MLLILYFSWYIYLGFCADLRPNLLDRLLYSHPKRVSVTASVCKIFLIPDFLAEFPEFRAILGHVMVIALIQQGGPGRIIFWFWMVLFNPSMKQTIVVAEGTGAKPVASR